MNIIITLAGHSRRFKEKGYDKPKFLIDINSFPMIYYVVKMFDTNNDKYFFVLNTEQKKENPEIENVLKNCVKNCNIIEIEPHEQGPIHTALQVKNIDKNEPVIVSYCDFFLKWNYKKFLKEVEFYDGAIPSFKGFHPASFGDTYYAYTRQNENNELLELREKKSFTSVRSEEFANSGIYYFKKQELFKLYGEKFNNGDFENLKEGYVSLLFNYMVEDKLKIKISEVEKFICWGTPEDLEQYFYWSDIFKNKTDVNFDDDFHQREYNYWKEFFNEMSLV